MDDFKFFRHKPEVIDPYFDYNYASSFCRHQPVLDYGIISTCRFCNQKITRKEMIGPFNTRYHMWALLNPEYVRNWASIIASELTTKIGKCPDCGEQLSYTTDGIQTTYFCKCGWNDKKAEQERIQRYKDEYEKKFRRWHSLTPL